MIRLTSVRVFATFGTRLTSRSISNFRPRDALKERMEIQVSTVALIKYGAVQHFSLTTTCLEQHGHLNTSRSLAWRFAQRTNFCNRSLRVQVLALH